MKILNTLLLSIWMLCSFAVYAAPPEHCKANQGFLVQFWVTGNDNEQQVYLTHNGNHPNEVIWHTGAAEKSDSSSNIYHFYDDYNSIQKGSKYEIRIYHQNNVSTYYRRPYNQSYWEETRQIHKEIKDGDLSISSGTITIENPTCEGAGSGKPDEPVLNRSPKFEFGTLDCTQGNSCQLDFDNKYKETPLVFVMPVIDQSLTTATPERKTEFPSTIGVKAVTSERATLYQDFAPSDSRDRTAKYWPESETPMGMIDYFVIEPGVLELNNGSKIVAGFVEVNADDGAVASQYQKEDKHGNVIDTERDHGVSVTFSDFGLTSGFDTKPGILVQAQTANNASSTGTHWVTALARDADLGSQSFILALDRSEVYAKKNGDIDPLYNPVTKKEKVAFVAGQGSGFIDGLKFWLGDGTTLYTLDANDEVIDPVLRGCDVYTPFPTGVSFDTPPVLVANKNSRKGNNGGWLRRCDVRTSDVAFINEEDMQRNPERKHTDEQVGWFMFEKPHSNPICSAFNSPVQTWYEENANGQIIGGDGYLNVQNATVRILGTEVDTNRPGERLVGFSSDNIVVNSNSTKPCDGQDCSSEEGLKKPKEALGAFIVSNVDLYLAGYTGYQKNLELSNSASYGEVKIQHGGTLILNTGEYWFESIFLSNTGAIVVPEGNEVVIHTKKVYMTNDSFMGVTVMGNNPDHDPSVYRARSLNIVSNDQWFSGESHLRVNIHEDSQFEFSLPQQTPYNTQVKLDLNAVFTGLMYNESGTYLTSTSKLYGSLTTKDVYLDSSASIIRSSGCLPPLASYELEVTPPTQLSLMCGTERPEFDILTKNAGLPESVALDLKVKTEAGDSVGESFELSVMDGMGVFLGGNRFKTNDDGKLKVSVLVEDGSAQLLGNKYHLETTMVDDSSITKTVKFAYTPYKFDIKPASDSNWNSQPIQVIANKPAYIDVRVLACADSDSPVILDYDEKLSLTDGSITSSISAPDNGVGSFSSQDIDFGSNKGVVENVEVMFTEAGIVNVHLEDTGFDCSNFPSLVNPLTGKCPIEGGGALTGEFEVWARPWKFAVCTKDKNGEFFAATGNSSSGSPYVSVGEQFSVTATPIKYGSPVCHVDQISTENYFLSEGGELSVAKVLVEFNHLTPTVEEGAEIGQLSGTLETSVITNGSDNEYTFSDLSYSEGGSIQLSISEYGSFYSGIEVDDVVGLSGSINVGRFYPYKFEVFNASWETYADQGYSVYMGQPFPRVNFDIIARGYNNEDVNNYSLFAPKYKADFYLTGLHSDRVNIEDSELSDANWNKATWSKTWVNSIQWSKAFDGPFNSSQPGDPIFTSSLQLSLDSLASCSQTFADPTMFKADAELGECAHYNFVFEKQPDVRLGRVNIDSVVGEVGKSLTIPLRVEYWVSSQSSGGVGAFVNNTHDDRFSFSTTGHETPEYIWPDDGSDCPVTLSGSGKVSDGRSRGITASQTCGTLVRQQSKMALGLDSFEWLKFDWDRSGTESDPAFNVTFGVQRGNDRVIYRGEPNQ